VACIELSELKQFLQNYRALGARERNIRKEIERINDRIEAMRGLSARTLQLAAGGGSRSLSDVTYLKAEKIIDTYDQEVNALLDEISGIQRGRARLNELLGGLDSEERDVIAAKYLENTKWDFLPEKVHMSRAQCFRVHDRAIMKMLNR